MNLEAAQKLCDEILQKYGITHSECNFERVDGQVKFIHLTIKIKIEPENGRKKIVDIK